MLRILLWIGIFVIAIVGAMLPLAVFGVSAAWLSVLAFLGVFIPLGLVVRFGGWMKTVIESAAGVENNDQNKA